VASIVAMLEPVTASLFGVVVLKESLAGLQIFGMGLILVTVTGLSVYSRSARLPASI
jgi:threonine/homoserine efflux transporter RhtA